MRSSLLAVRCAPPLTRARPARASRAAQELEKQLSTTLAELRAARAAAAGNQEKLQRMAQVSMWPCAAVAPSWPAATAARTPAARSGQGRRTRNPLVRGGSPS
jgi:hypothetical protein